jgi:hypothetical protein
MMQAPAALASSGAISGVGLASERCQTSIAVAEAARDAELQAIAHDRAEAALAADREKRREAAEQEGTARIEHANRVYCQPPNQCEQRCTWQMEKVEAERDKAMAAID